MQPLRFIINRCPERGQLCPRESTLRNSRTWLSALQFMSVRFHPRFAWCLAVFLAGLALRASAQPEAYGNPDSSAFIRIPSDADDWTRHFHIGAMVGMNISASFNMAGALNVNRPAGIYDDGYVHPSGNAFGTTTDWGYDSASQYNAATHTLTMTGASSFSPIGSASQEENGSVFPGFDMTYGDNLWYWKHARVGWEFGFGLLPINITDNQPISGQINQNVYSFSTGTIESMPPPGYPGGSTGSAPAIYSTAVATNQTSYPGTVTGSHTLDVMLYTFRLGPSFYWDLTDHFGMSLGAGPAVGIVSGDYKYNEIIGSTPNTGRISGTEMVYGGYVNATLLYHVQDNADIFVSAQYMPMSDATIGGQGREGRLNLDGQLCFTIGVSWPF